MCIYRNTQTGEKVAVKFDPKNLPKDAPSSVLKECKYLKEYNGKLTYAPKYYAHTTINNRRFMIIQFLEQSVEEHIKER